VDPEFGYSTTHQSNILSDCPVLSVPSGFADNGVPTGIQIVGRPFDDVTSIAQASLSSRQGELGINRMRSDPE